SCSGAPATAASCPRARTSGARTPRARACPATTRARRTSSSGRAPRASPTRARLSQRSARAPRARRRPCRERLRWATPGRAQPLLPPCLLRLLPEPRASSVGLVPRREDGLEERLAPPLVETPVLLPTADVPSHVEEVGRIVVERGQPALPQPVAEERLHHRQEDTLIGADDLGERGVAEPIAHGQAQRLEHGIHGRRVRSSPRGLDEAAAPVLVEIALQRGALHLLAARLRPRLAVPG